MIEILYFIPILLSAFAIGNFIFIFFKLKITYLEESIFSIVLGFGFYSYITLFLGLMGWLYALVYWILILLSLVLWHRSCLVLIKSIFNQTRNFKIKFNIETFLIVAIAVFALLSVLSALVPPFLWDEMDYRLAHPKIWARNHELTPIYSRWFSEFPSNIDMLFVVGILLKNGILAKLFSLSYGLLLAFSIYSFGKRFYGKRIGLIAASIYISLPMVMNHIGSAYIDLSVALLVFLALYSFFMWLDSNNSNWIYLSAILTGYSSASKHTALFPAFVLGLFTLYFAIKKEKFTNLIKKMLIFGLIILLLLSPWYIKTYVRAGNPVWPIAYNVLGGRYWDSDIDSQFSRDLNLFDFSFTNLLLLPWNLTMHSSSFAMLLGWNSIFLAFVPLLLFFRKIEKHTKILLSYIFAFLYGGIFFFALFYGIMRYLVIYPALSIISATVISHLYNLKYYRKFVLILVLLTFIFTAGLWFAIFGQKAPYILGIDDEREFYGKLADYNGYPVFEFINQNLPSDSVIFFFRETRGYLSDRDYIIALPNEQKIFDYGKNADEFYRQLKGHNVTHVLINTNIGFYKPQAIVKNRIKPISQENQDMVDRLLKMHGTLIFEDEEIYLYLLK